MDETKTILAQGRPSATNAPLVSVIMNCHNAEKYLHEAINSVYSQTYSNWEIIFWDNASTDGSGAIAQSYDQRLRYFRGDEHRSLGDARNQALSKARGEVITFLDCDDRWLPGKLAQQIRIFNERPDVGFVYSNFTVLNTLVDRTYEALHGEQPEGEVFERFLYHYPVGILTAAIRTSVLRRIGELFDPQLRWAEEYDVFMRVIRISPAAYIKEPLAVYRAHSGMYSVSRRDSSFCEELDYILDKLERTDPASAARYAKAFEHGRRKNQFLRARFSLLNGDPGQARRNLQGLSLANAKHLLCYIFTFVPGRAFTGFYEFVMRNEFLRKASGILY